MLIKICKGIFKALSKELFTSPLCSVCVPELIYNCTKHQYNLDTQITKDRIKAIFSVLSAAKKNSAGGEKIKKKGNLLHCLELLKKPHKIQTLQP